MIVQLNESHLEDCLDIACLKSRVSGTKPLDKKVLKEKIAKFFSNDENNYAFGHISNTNEITSWIAITFQENKKRGRYWAIVVFYAKYFKSYFKFKDSEYEMLIRHCIDFSERKNYYQFYYSVSKRISDAFSEQWKKSNLTNHESYISLDVDIIPANTKPASELYWRLLGEELKPDDMLIKHRIKKQ